MRAFTKYFDFLTIFIRNILGNKKKNPQSIIGFIELYGSNQT